MIKFDKMMQQFTEEHNLYRSMIMKIDEAVIQKASKASLIESEIYTREHYARKTDFEGVTKIHEGHLGNLDNEIEKLN